MLKALIKSSKFHITVVKRVSSSATFPDDGSVTILSADLSSVSSVTSAFQDQDAVISTVGDEALLGLSILIAAAVAANVKRFLPSDFGPDLANPHTAALPGFEDKLAIHELLRQAAAANPHFTYSLVVNGAFLDWGLKQNLLLNWKESRPKLYDGGINAFSATTLDTIGQAVVGILTHPEETKNRFVYVKEIDISQLQLLEIAKKVFFSFSSSPGKKKKKKTWEEPVMISTAEIAKSGYESLAKGKGKGKGEVTPPEVVLGFHFLVVFGPERYGRLLTRTDNELLGVKELTVEDVEGVFGGLIEEDLRRGGSEV